MATFSPIWPQNAAALLAQAKEASAADGELVKLVMAGIRRVDSWLIENRVLPALADRPIKILRFTRTGPGQERHCAALVPLPDGSAFACSVGSRWSVLDDKEAQTAIQYIGHHYAQGEHWARGFEASVQAQGGEPAAATPAEIAALWENMTGFRPHGFDPGILDHIQALSLNVIDRAFNTQGELGF